MLPSTMYTTAQTLSMAAMLFWMIISITAAILLTLPNSVHPTRRCATQAAYLFFTYAGFAGLFQHNYFAIFMLTTGGVIYYREWKKVKKERQKDRRQRTEQTATM